MCAHCSYMAKPELLVRHRQVAQPTHGSNDDCGLSLPQATEAETRTSVSKSRRKLESILHGAQTMPHLSTWRAGFAPPIKAIADKFVPRINSLATLATCTASSLFDHARMKQTVDTLELGQFNLDMQKPGLRCTLRGLAPPLEGSWSNCSPAATRSEQETRPSCRSLLARGSRRPCPATLAG